MMVLPLLVAGCARELLALVKTHVPQSTRILYACAKDRLDVLPQGLNETGYLLKEFPVYESKLAPVRIEGKFDQILFFSPSAVKAYFQINGWVPGTFGVCIGETTAEMLRQFGVHDILIAPEPDEGEMLEAIDKYLKNR